MPDVILLYTTWPDAEKAQAAADAAISRRLAACANILAPIRACYRWQGEIEHAEEIPMILKASAAAAPELRRLLVSIHPYEIPCIIGWPVSPALSHPAFLEWVHEQTPAPEAPWNPPKNQEDTSLR